MLSEPDVTGRRHLVCDGCGGALPCFSVGSSRAREIRMIRRVAQYLGWVFVLDHTAITWYRGAPDVLRGEDLCDRCMPLSLLESMIE